MTNEQLYLLIGTHAASLVLTVLALLAFRGKKITGASTSNVKDSLSTDMRLANLAGSVKGMREVMDARHEAVMAELRRVQEDTAARLKRLESKTDKGDEK
jgi:hypothetical protein